MLFTRQQLNKRHKTGLKPSKPRLGESPPNLAKTKNWLRDILLSPVLAFCAIYAVTAVTALVAPYAHSPILACSMGASAVIVFVAPNSRFSTPWSLLGGHLLSALIGISCAIHIPDLALSAAAAVAGSMFIMQLFHCMNPPGAATALAPVVTPHDFETLSYYFLLTPILMNVLVILFISIAINRLLRFIE